MCKTQLISDKMTSSSVFYLTCCVSFGEQGATINPPELSFVKRRVLSLVRSKKKNENNELLYKHIVLLLVSYVCRLDEEEMHFI